MQSLISENTSLWCNLMSRPRLNKVMSRFRLKRLQGGDDIGRIKWTSELSRPGLSMSRLRLSMGRPRLNEIQEEKERDTGKELEAVMSRDRLKESSVEELSRNRVNYRPKGLLR